MKDLTCETPHTFNIRRVREGVLTKRTKRNIHCIIALKRVHQTTSSQLYNMDSSFGTEEYDGEIEEVPPSEVEDLDSADSDYPESQEGESTSSHNLQSVHMMDLDCIDAVETSTTTDTTLTLVGQLDTSMTDVTQPVAVGVRRRGTFTKEGPDIPIKLTRTASSDSDYSVSSGGGDTSELPLDGEGNSESGLNRSGSFSLEDGAGKSRMKRSGTFTIHAPTERPQAWSSDDDSDTSGLDQEGIRRTITRESSAELSFKDSEAIAKSSSSSESELSLDIRREGTYTVITPSVDFLDPQADIDLDKTLKASDFEDSI